MGAAGGMAAMEGLPAAAKDERAGVYTVVGPKETETGGFFVDAVVPILLLRLAARRRAAAEPGPAGAE